MRMLDDVLRQKESELQIVQKEIEALRLVIRLVAVEDEPEEERIPDSVSASSPLANEPALRHVMQGYSAAESLKQFP